MTGFCEINCFKNNKKITVKEKINSCINKAISKIDYCNTTYNFIADFNLNKENFVQN